MQTARENHEYLCRAIGGCTYRRRERDREIEGERERKRDRGRERERDANMHIKVGGGRDPRSASRG